MDNNYGINKIINYNILGITGKARVGKDTLTKFILEVYADRYPTRNWYVYHFADPLKAAAKILFKLSNEELYGDKKNKHNIFWEMTPREIMQKLGTESIRNIFREDFWLKRAELELYPLINNNSLIIIPDVRFENEADWIRSRKGLVAHITKGPKENEEELTETEKKHSSENILKIEEDDKTLENHKTFADLRFKAEQLVELYLEFKNEGDSENNGKDN